MQGQCVAEAKSSPRNDFATPGPQPATLRSSGVDGLIGYRFFLKDASMPFDRCFMEQSPAAIHDPGAHEETAGDDKRLVDVKRRVLVVDDNQDTADSLALMLEALGHQARTAYDGARAIALADEFRPDVILMDIGMPRFNGFQAAQRIRAQPWADRVVLIAITGWARDEDKACSKEAGFDAHLTKPVDLKLLFRLLAAMNQPPSAVSDDDDLSFRH
jgi:CheY-like chemotaxis protein